MKKLIKGFGAALIERLPDKYYFHLFLLISPLVTPERRGHKKTFGKNHDGTYWVRSGESVWYYIGSRRFERYLYPNGFVYIKDKIFAKYMRASWRLTTSDEVIDIGANVGEFSMACIDRGCKVYAFEPDPRVFSCLEKNVLRSGVKTFNSAMSSAEGLINFYVSSETADSSCISPDSFSEVITVPALTIDSFLMSMDVEKVELLKVEAEGYEPEVLAGLDSCRDRIRRISVDTSPERRGVSTTTAVVAELRRKGFLTEVCGYVVYGWRKSSEE